MKSPVPQRGLQNIRTMSERISDVDNPQRKYLTLAMLELERARRSKEKRAAAQRVADIDQRLADITAEQAELLAAAETEMAGGDPAQRAESDPQTGGGFRISY